MDEANPQRSECLACGRPDDLCVCGAIVRVPNRTPVTVVQHPGERRHVFNTVRLARLALEQCDVQVAWDVELEPLPLPEGAALLYPGPDALDLAHAAPPSHLVVLDGTWPQAKALYKANPWLQQLPHVQLMPEEPSAYAIRREPAPHCLSSIESITAALRLCEPDNPAIDDLLLGFHALVNGQITHRAKQPGRPRTLQRASGTQRERLARDWDRIVVVYAETTPLRGMDDGLGTQVLQLTAVRPASGEVFDHLAAVRVPPNACVLDHMELVEAEVHAAATFRELAEHWSDFRRPDDQFVAWSLGGAMTAFEHLGETVPITPLKSIYCNIHKGPSGRPDQVLAREGVTYEHVPVRGRAARRLGIASALAGWLRR